MLVGDFLKKAICFEKNLEVLYRDLSGKANETYLKDFLNDIADDEASHARSLELALSLCDPLKKMIDIDSGQLMFTLEMIDDIHDEVMLGTFNPEETFEILAHMENFAEEKFYGSIGNQQGVLPEGLIEYLKETCGGHAQKLKKLINDHNLMNI